MLLALAPCFFVSCGPLAPEQTPAGNETTTAVASNREPVPEMEIQWVTYKDPQGYFILEVPEGYHLREEPSDWDSKRIFEYGPDLRLTVMASTRDEPWIPEETMNEKIKQIVNGEAPIPEDVSLVMSELVTISGCEGYMLVFQGKRKNTEMHMISFALAKGRRSLAFMLVATHDSVIFLYENILQAIREKLVVADEAKVEPCEAAAPLPKSVASSAEASPAEDGKLAPMSDEWRAAASEFKINKSGTMTQGNDMVVLYKGAFYKMGETVQVDYQNKKYPFVITAVDRHRVEIEPLPDALEESPPQP